VCQRRGESGGIDPPRFGCREGDVGVFMIRHCVRRCGMECGPGIKGDDDLEAAVGESMLKDFSLDVKVGLF